MQLSKEQLEKFKALNKDHFGDELSDQEALGKAIQLVSLMRLIYKPMTQEEMDRVMKRKNEIGLDRAI